MAAFIPSRRDPEVNAAAIAKVREDKRARGVATGFDGTWVAHPDLVPVVAEVFDARSARARTSSTGGARTSSVDRRRAARRSTIPGRRSPTTASRNNISVGAQYIAAWLGGRGAVAIFNLMEDAATAEISRSQIWQWLRHGRVARADVERMIAEQAAELDGTPHIDQAVSLFERVALGENSMSS